MIRIYNISFDLITAFLNLFLFMVQGKLDGYRADYQRGKTLNDDQKSAIAKYDEVCICFKYIFLSVKIGWGGVKLNIWTPIFEH